MQREHKEKQKIKTKHNSQDVHFVKKGSSTLVFKKKGEGEQEKQESSTT
jgi:hypothetical protein